MSDQDEKYIAEQLAKRTAGLPAPVLQALAELPPARALQFMDEHGEKFAELRKLPEQQAISAAVAALSPQERDMARAAGWTPEQFVAVKKKHGKGR